MEPSHAERRRQRRIDLEAPVRIRRDGSPAAPDTDHLTRNVGLAGLYFEIDDASAFHLDEAVTAFVSIPESQRRTFPFTRLAGRSRVVRIRELPPAPPQGAKRFGIALEFGQDVTALTAIPPRG